MPKINPWGHARPKAEVQTRTFRERGQEMEITFASLRDDPLAQSRAIERGQEYADDFVNPKDPGNSGFPCPDGAGRVLLTRGACINIAFFEVMQETAGVPEEERYAFAEWVGVIDRLPRTYTRLAEWAREFNAEEDDDAGNAAGAATTESSASPSATASATPS
jgi:hypothetical protein